MYMEFFRRHHTAFHVFTFAVVAVFLITIFVPQIKAVGGYIAAGILGQYEATEGPDFTTSVAGTDAQGLTGPTGVKIDIARQLIFVIDQANSRILVYNMDGDGNISDYSADYAFTSSYIDYQGEMDYDPVNHYLFIASPIKRSVYIFDVSDASLLGLSYIEGFTYDLPPIGNVGYTDNPCQFSQGEEGLFLCLPYGVAVDDDGQYFYVSDSTGHRVLQYSVAATITSGLDGLSSPALHVFGQPDLDTFSSGTSSTTLNNPGHIAFGSDILYVSDVNNRRIISYDTSSITDGEPAVAVWGQPDFDSGDFIGCSISTLCSAAGVSLAITETSNLFVGDANRVILLAADLDGDALDPPVLGQVDFDSNTTGTTASTLNAVGGVDISNDDFLYISDYNNNRVIIQDLRDVVANGQDAINLIGQVSDSLGDTPLFDQATKNSNLDSGTTINDSGFDNPIDVAIDTVNHRLFVAETYKAVIGGVHTDGNERVLVFNLDSNNELIDYDADNVLFNTDFSNWYSPFSTPFGIAPYTLAYDDVHDILYSAAFFGACIEVFDTSSISDNQGPIREFLMSGIDCNPTDLDVKNVSIAIDPEHELLYASYANENKVVVFDVSDITTTYPTVVATLGTTSGTTQSKFDNPVGLAIDPDEQILYVADKDNQRIMVFDVSTVTDGEPAINVLGNDDFTTVAGSVTQSEFLDPFGVTLDKENKILYVSTSGGGASRILLFDVADITDGEDAVGVIGSNSFVSTDSGTSESLLNTPKGMSFDYVDTRLYVADNENNRIVWFDFPLLNTPSVPDGVVGTPYSEALDVTREQGSVSFELISGTLPPGLAFDASGITGTPTTGGTYIFTARAIDAFSGSNFYSNPIEYTINIPVVGGGGGGGGGGHGGGETCSDPLATNYLGSLPCTYPTDVCPNISGNQSSIPSGMIIDASGNCVIAPSNTDFCPNIAGIQDEVPNGMVINGSGNCVTPTGTGTGTGTPPSTSPDVCPNIAGRQPRVPDGMTKNSAGQCIEVVSVIDVCPNLTGNQSAVPTGLELRGGQCLPPQVEVPTCETDPSLCAPGEENPPIRPPSLHGCVFDAPPGSSLGVIVGTQISGSFCEAKMTVLGVYAEAKEVFNSPQGDAITKAIGITGIVVAGLITLATALFATPLTFTEIALIPQRVWSLLLVTFGLKKRIRPWGTVYDAVTKQPLDPVYVVLYDKSGAEIATSITDLDGRYGFLVGPGVYQMRATKQNYVFPSIALSRQSRDEIYLDLYFGNYFEVTKENQLITKNIPMDPVKFDWNEFVKREKGLMKFYSKRDIIITRIADAFFGVGFVAALIALLVSPTGYNVAIFTLYVLLLVMKEMGVKPKELGGVMKKDGSPLSFGIVRIYSKSLDKELMTKVLDKKGSYYALVPNATYYVTIEEKLGDKSYREVYKSQPFEVKDGVINKKFLV